MTPGLRGILAHKQSIRLFGIIIVFFLGISAFVSGVDTSGVEDMSELSIFAWIYYSAGLFVFAGLDLGVPVGGTAVGRGALWVAYFLGPIITTTTVIEAALQLIRRDRFQARDLDGHVIVIGASRLGLTYIQAVRHIEPERQVLLVDAEGDKISAEEAGLLEDIQFVRASLDRKEAFESFFARLSNSVIWDGRM